MQGPNGCWFCTSDREIETVEPLPVVSEHVVESVLKARQTLASALSFFRDPDENDGKSRYILLSVAFMKINFQ